MQKRFEQSRNFMSRAKALEKKAAEASDLKIREVLLSLAEQYRHLAVQAANGPYE
jgi:hypothetical protein